MYTVAHSMLRLGISGVKRAKIVNARLCFDLWFRRATHRQHYAALLGLLEWIWKSTSAFACGRQKKGSPLHWMTYALQAANTPARFRV